MTSSSFTDLLDLASEHVGGCVLEASDDFFAEKENLIKAADPGFVPGKYTDRGKWMDGWESRRRRGPGYDWAVLRLGIPGIIRGVTIDTRFFTGNYPEQAALEACTAEPGACAEQLTDWIELIPRSPLQGDRLNPFEVSSSQRFTHVRLNIFPDGGVARLRVYGEASPDWRAVTGEIDLAAAENGAVIVGSSDSHYGDPRNLIMPGLARDMRGGWETRRRRGPGHDWAIIRLAAEGIIERVEVDTSHFKGNFPDRCSLDVSPSGEEQSWVEVLAESKLQADMRRVFDRELTAVPAARYARFNIYPDGGVSRLRLFGRMTDQGRVRVRLTALNAAPAKQAVADFTRCCGSTVWASRMAAGRPYPDIAELESAADSNWSSCAGQDRLEAFAAHPAIGARSGRWSSEEQAGAARADADTLNEIRELNTRYREKFGYTFIVYATGKTAEEMLDILRRRMGNCPEDEIERAAEEQRQITRLRLRKLLSE